MRYEYRLQYNPCAMCVGKSHCAECSARIAEAITKPGLAENVEADTKEKYIRFDADPADIPDIEDALEGAGAMI